MNAIKIKPLSVLLLTFVAGWTGSTLSNGNINRGLVTALNSVLGNLLGETAAGTKIGIINPDILDPEEGVRIDISKDTAIPVAMSVFFPPDPVAPDASCKFIAQLNVTSERIRAIINPEIFPAGTSPVVIESGIIDPDILPAPCVASGVFSPEG